MKPDSISYYPHIEFQNVAWVKSSLLLWNHVCRIVPFIDFEAEAPDSTLRRLS